MVGTLLSLYYGLVIRELLTMSSLDFRGIYMELVQPSCMHAFLEKPSPQNCHGHMVIWSHMVTYGHGHTWTHGQVQAKSDIGIFVLFLQLYVSTIK